jgi:hypothetical protein
MMIQIFVHADDKDGDPLVADHYEFAAVPRVGEHVVVDNDSKEVTLRVVAVTHLAEPKGDVMSPLSHVNLKCEVAD